MRRSVAVDHLLEGWTDDQQSIADVLRSIILDAEPAIQESVKFNIPFYVMNGLLIYISPQKKGGLLLAFCQGRLMSDSEQVFVGHDRKEVRHVPLIEMNSDQFETIQRYVDEAIAINRIRRSFTMKQNQ
jgi:hypothetical protein